MKGYRLFLILVITTFGANADSPRPFPMTAPIFSATMAIKPKLVAGFRNDIVRDARATRAFIRRGAGKFYKYDVWLLLLTAVGLIVVQLRRTQRLLPQRSIIAYQ